MPIQQNLRSEPTTPSDFRSKFAFPIISGIIVAAIGGTFGTILMFQGDLSRLAGRLEGIRQIAEPAVPAGKQETLSAGTAEEIMTVIQNQQRLHVKESWGEAADQCFTAEDLNWFMSSRTTDGIVGALRHEAHFIRIVDSLRKMDADDRTILLAAADKPLRPTWAQIGQISRTGTTEAGQKAEQLIASAIVTLTKELTEPPIPRTMP